MAKGTKNGDGFAMKIRGSARDIIIDSDGDENELDYNYDNVDDLQDEFELEELSSGNETLPAISSQRSSAGETNLTSIMNMSISIHKSELARIDNS